MKESKKYNELIRYISLWYAISIYSHFWNSSSELWPLRRKKKEIKPGQSKSLKRETWSCNAFSAQLEAWLHTGHRSTFSGSRHIHPGWFSFSINILDLACFEQARLSRNGRQQQQRQQQQRNALNLDMYSSRCPLASPQALFVPCMLQSRRGAASKSDLPARSLLNAAFWHPHLSVNLTVRSLTGSLTPIQFCIKAPTPRYKGIRHNTNITPPLNI